MLSLMCTLLLAFSPFNNVFLLNQLSRRSLLVSAISSNKFIDYSKDFNYSKINNDIIKLDNGENNAIIHTIKNNIYFTGPLTDESVFAITTNLISLQYRDFDEINLHLQSGGGSLLPSLGLVDLIRTSDIPINTFIDGYVASAATLISIVGTKRFISKHGAMLVHELKMSNEYSKYKEIKDYSANADTLMQIIKDIYLEYTSIDENKLNYLLEHDLWLNSTQCQNYGFVDILI
jgi:ATP-dependent protease ClpP protease subunit